MTNHDYFLTLTVVQLKNILKDFNHVGFSKMRKSELALTVTVLMDGAHLDAATEDAAQSLSETFDLVARISGTPMSAQARKSYYSAQNGTSRLTAKQSRRLAKKAFKIHAGRMDIDAKLRELKLEIAGLKAKGHRRTPKDEAAIIAKQDLVTELNLKKNR
ncbi:MAG: hypothetical protein L6R40_008784 [Gallowayella cf. fulva]|nr:MAG: hypothetical protein L6R40_008784 [Xanthomendoza cf. fulva]